MKVAVQSLSRMPSSHAHDATTLVCVTKWRSPHVNWQICAYWNIYPININRNCCHDLYNIRIYNLFQSSQVNKLPALSYLFDMWFSELTFSLYCSLQGLGWSRDAIFVYTATLLTLSCRCKPHAMCCCSGLLHRLPAVQWFVAAWIFHSGSWFHRPVNERWKLTSLVSLVIGSVWSSFSSWDVQCWFAQSRYTQNLPPHPHPS
jgi:hypothetical protein